MTITITIECDNAAFVDNPREVTTILERLAAELDGASLVDYRGSTRLLDSNGNTVGSVTVTD
jgi:hypothetical protein